MASGMEAGTCNELPCSVTISLVLALPEACAVSLFPKIPYDRCPGADVALEGMRRTPSPCIKISCGGSNDTRDSSSVSANSARMLDG